MVAGSGRRVGNIRGNSSLLIAIQGYDLSSFSMMLYRGLNCLIMLFSNNNASHSESTTVVWMSLIFVTNIRTLAES